MAEQRPQRNPGPTDREPARRVRFEATIHAGPRLKRDNWIERLDRLDIDRLPDAKGEIRALVTPGDCVELLDQGFEVRLYHAHPIRPVDPTLIETDESVRRKLDDELRGLRRATPAGSDEPGAR
jgi:hypothetical protein